MNLQFDLCCSDFSFTNTTSRNPSLHKRKREHGSQRAQRGLLSDPIQTNHSLTANLFQPLLQNTGGERGRMAALRGSAGTNPQKEHHSHWCPEPCGGSGLLQSVLLAAPAQSLSWNSGAGERGLMTKSPGSLGNDLAPRAGTMDPALP